ncbi:flagellar protein FlaG [Lebetimonas natsushimae]|uniref:Flagellar protein FlaG n=1 Tax=Lebetimonas natsushimae TaxID=1936991 RepID=A0A292YD03_9BACT|nr:flagellar protein FlaG [Lebetimonas natsushimae]GAX87220.1 flagellar protein FlaG [Lebetimonas natsushimae]
MDIFSSIKNNAQKIYNYDSLNQHSNRVALQKIDELAKNDDEKTLTQKVQAQDKKIEKKELKKELQKVVEELNKALNPLNTSLKFKFNDKIDFLTVQVVDTKTNETIREFPPKEALRLMEKMREIVGMLFDKKG